MRLDNEIPTSFSMCSSTGGCPKLKWQQCPSLALPHPLVWSLVAGVGGGGGQKSIQKCFEMSCTLWWSKNLRKALAGLWNLPSNKRTKRFLKVPMKPGEFLNTLPLYHKDFKGQELVSSGDFSLPEYCYPLCYLWAQQSQTKLVCVIWDWQQIISFINYLINYKLFSFSEKIEFYYKYENSKFICY